MKYFDFKLKLRAVLAVFMLLAFGAFANAQKITVTGSVKDAVSSEPIIGASILEKGTTNGTITDVNGQFSISVSPKAILVVQYVGYKTQEVPVANQRKLSIKLSESAVALNEVVAIGYGTVKKNDATGSIAAIKPDAMNKGLETNAQDMITGKIAGVNVTSAGGTPGGGATIRIRGGSSLNATNDPLIVVDGLALDDKGIGGVSNPLSMINPNDIATFTVLKDASATAIYGSRASNGVILITTKKGKKGTKPHVTYNGNFSVSSVKKTYDVMSGDQFRAFADTLFADSPDILKKLGTANTDWQSLIYQDAISHDHNINITGGLKNMPYRVSVGYTNQDGIIKTSNFERYTGSFTINPTFFQDHLKVNISAKGMIVNNRFADDGVVGAAASMDPTQPVTSTDSKYVNNFGGYYQWTTTADGIVYANSLATKNPVATLNQKKDISNAKDFIGNAELDYKVHFLPDLHLHLNLGMETSSGIQTLYIDSLSGSDTHHGRRGYNKKTKYNKSLTYYMQYFKDINKENKFDVMVGYEWQEFYNDEYYTYEGLETDIVDPNDSTHIGGYNHQTKLTKFKDRLVSFLGRANYSFSDKYLATFSLRADGSSHFAPENRWSLFPAVALAWKMKDEDFLQDVSAVSDMKLRLGYGVTGQQNLGDLDGYYLPVYTQSINGASYPIGTNNSYIVTYRPNAYNTKLKWEQTSTYNGGLDFGFLDMKISGSLDYYYRVTKNLLNIIDVPAGTNFSNRVWSNIGSLSNSGVEFNVNVRPITRKNFSWEINYNATYNKNKITELTVTNGTSSIINEGDISAGTGNTVQAFAVGQPAYSFYVYQQVYDSITHKPIEGKFVDRNKDGVINGDDRYFDKKPSPDVTMGLSSKLIYKNFDFSFTLRASLGNYMYNDVDARSAYVGQNGVYSASGDGFFSNKPLSSLVTNFTENATNYYLSDYYIQNASFLKCDNITLGYSFKNLFKAISSGRIYVAVQNPFVITAYKGIDPEVYGGIDNSIYPRPLVSILGLSLNF